MWPWLSTNHVCLLVDEGGAREPERTQTNFLPSLIQITSKQARCWWWYSSDTPSLWGKPLTLNSIWSIVPAKWVLKIIDTKQLEVLTLDLVLKEPSAAAKVSYSNKGQGFHRKIPCSAPIVFYHRTSLSASLSNPDEADTWGTRTETWWAYPIKSTCQPTCNTAANGLPSAGKQDRNEKRGRAKSWQLSVNDNAKNRLGTKSQHWLYTWKKKHQAVFTFDYDLFLEKDWGWELR